MTAEAAAGIIAQQQHYEHPQGVFLKIGAGIGRMSVRIESAFVADAYGVPVVVLAMGADFLQRAAAVNLSVARDVEV